MEDPGPLGRREVQVGGVRLPYHYGHEEASADRGGGHSERGVRGGAAGVSEEQGAGAEWPGAGGEPPLFLPTPDFVAMQKRSRD